MRAVDVRNSQGKLVSEIISKHRLGPIIALYGYKYRYRTDKLTIRWAFVIIVLA
jgi:hypothetical protein